MLRWDKKSMVSRSGSSIAAYTACKISLRRNLVVNREGDKWVVCAMAVVVRFSRRGPFIGFKGGEELALLCSGEVRANGRKERKWVMALKSYCLSWRWKDIWMHGRIQPRNEMVICEDGRKVVSFPTWTVMCLYRRGSKGLLCFSDECWWLRFRQVRAWCWLCVLVLNSGTLLFLLCSCGTITHGGKSSERTN